MRNFFLIISIVLCLQQKTQAQLEQENNYGFNVGLVSAIGTHTHRFGVAIQGYYIYNFAQVNASFRLYDNARDLGPRGEHAEISTALGLCLGYGKKNTELNPFINSISNQTGYKNSIAYSYNVWLNKIKTSQVTGIVALQFNHFSIIAENDLLAKPMLDRFRTGAFLLQYQNGNFQYAINCTMWTGQLGRSVRNDSLFPYIGYLNANGGVYPNLSHGLLSGQVKYANEYGQYLQGNIGIDAEQVRDVMQNRLIHDMPFIPKKWNNGQNLHLPMIDNEGNQYLYRKNQKIREPKFYMNLFSSPNLFY